MSKKILAVFAVAIVSLGLANTAKADCNGIYLGGRLGTYEPKLEKSGSLSGYEIGERAMTYSGAIGYRYNYVRAELEFAFREEPEKKVNIAGSIAKETFEAQSYMFNLIWDLSPYTMFTPYLMGGVGMSEIAFRIERAGPTDEFDDTNFTWHGGGGLSAKVTSRFNIDVGYRYWDFGKLNSTRVTAQEFYGGLRYVF